MSEDTNDDVVKIVGFVSIFEGKLSKLLDNIKQLKKTRKTPEEKEQLRRCIKEAKQLKKLLKTTKKKEETYDISITSHTLMVTESHPLIKNIMVFMEPDGTIKITFSMEK